MNKVFLFQVFVFIVSFLTSTGAFSQRDYDTPYEEQKENEKEFNRLAHLNLKNNEIYRIVAGIGLVIFSGYLRKRNKTISNVVLISGILVGFQFVMIVLALFQKAWEYGITLAVFVGIIFFIAQFFENKK